jgi:translation elongation factor aEF-1 beta
MENAANLAAYTNVQNADSQDRKERINMGSVIVTYKVFPEDIVENFESLKKQIENIKPEFSAIEGYGEDPIAFGLVALLVQVKFPEDKTGIVDEFEEKLGKIPGISQAQTMFVRRSSR